MIRLRKIIVAHHQILGAEISGRFTAILEATKLNCAFITSCGVLGLDLLLKVYREGKGKISQYFHHSL